MIVKKTQGYVSKRNIFLYNVSNRNYNVRQKSINKTILHKQWDAKMKIKVTILDDDSNYVKRLIYAFSRIFAGNVEVCLFTLFEI